MTLPASGAISLSQVQTEFGGSHPISMSEYYAKASGIPSSGTISMSHFHGKSAVINLVISGSRSQWNASSYGVVAGKRYKVTINGGVVVRASSTSQVGMQLNVQNATIELVNNGWIIGRGGAGGKGHTRATKSTAEGRAGNGGAGTDALRNWAKTTIYNNGSMGGGGGGGGGSGAHSWVTGHDNYGVPNAWDYNDGCGGGGGASYGAAGAGGSIDGKAGAGGGSTSGGAGGSGSGYYTGGRGGGLGGAGAAGANGNHGTSAGGAGGAGGRCVRHYAGSVSWSKTGNRYGSI